LEQASPWLDAIFRWIHVVAGITWIGHLYFFNWVNSQLVKTYDADSKKKVLPELMPRALYWFRWGAAYTWVTGFLLLGIVYYMNESLLSGGNAGTAGAAPQFPGTGKSVAILILLPLLAFGLYDQLWKRVFAAKETVGVAVSFVAAVAIAFGLSRIVGGRTMFIHMGAMFGTLMAINVWMRIWPAQRKIIAGVKGTAAAPDAAIAAMAGLRSKHNTYMSVPLVLFMVSNHYPQLFSHELNYVFAGAVIAIGWGVTKLLYMKSATPAPAQF
jgi:uncharacterized membrane protein